MDRKETMSKIHDMVKNKQHGTIDWSNIYKKYGIGKWSNIGCMRSCYVRWRDANRVEKCEECGIKTTKLNRFKGRQLCGKCLIGDDLKEKITLSRSNYRNILLMFPILLFLLTVSCDPQYKECREGEQMCSDENEVMTCGYDTQWYYTDCNTYGLTCCYVDEIDGYDIDSITCSYKENCSEKQGE